MHKLKFKCILLLSEDTYDSRHFTDEGGCIMCTVEMASQINSNFMLTNLILSMEGTFTCSDICNLIKQYSSNIGKKTIEKALERLRENDYLEEIGYTYTVIPQEKSIRWGWH